MKRVPGREGVLGLVVATMAVTALLIAGWFREAPAAPGPALDPLAMAVLPFQQSDDDGPASVQMGIPEMLIIRLSLVPNLTVRPMSQVLALGPAPHDPVLAGRALGVLGVIAGDYGRHNGAWRARVRLIDAETGAVSWSHDVTFEGKDAPAFEEAVALEVVNQLMEQPQEALPAGGAAPQEASMARYLRLLASGSVASLDRTLAHESVVLLEAALIASPGSASVNATLAEASAGLFLGGESTDAAWLRRARALAQRAVWLDPDLAAGHLALGRVLRLQGEKVDSARNAVEALRRDPANGLALRLLGFLVSGCDDVRLLRESRERLVRLAPETDPGWLDFALAVREGTTASLMEKVQDELVSNRVTGRSTVLLLGHLGMLAVEARDTAAILKSVAQLDASGGSSAFSDGLRLHALALMGDVRGMQRNLDTNRESYTGQDEQAIWVALAWAQAGRQEEALEWVERAARLGSVDAWTLDHDSRFAGIRSDPRFERAGATVRARAKQIEQIARETLGL